QAAMEFCNKPGIINSVSMEGDKCDIVLPKIEGTDWGVVALLCDNSGIPEDAEGRLEVFTRVMEQMKKHDIAPNRVYIDPLVETLGANEESLIMFAEVTREVKKQYPSIHITSGLSNISFGLPYRRMINMAFLVLAMEAGMDSAIIDPLVKEFQGVMYAANALIGNDEMGIEYIGAFRDGVFGRPLKAAEKKLIVDAAEAGVAAEDKDQLEELLGIAGLK
ncbi:MAG: dihydropteroate synthase, partial [Coriobacteriales bacterium]